MKANRVFTIHDVEQNEDGNWGFSEDLAALIEMIMYGEERCDLGNNEVGDALVKAKVVTKKELDTESDRFYAYFKTQARALEFINALNGYFDKLRKKYKNRLEV